MDSKLILVVIGVIAMVCGSSEALTCYMCVSGTGSECLDPFKSDGVVTCRNATTCTKMWSSISGKIVTVAPLYHSHSTLLMPKATLCPIKVTYNLSFHFISFIELQKR